MNDSQQKKAEAEKTRAVLNHNQAKIKLCLEACASCSICAESCFLFNNNNHDPRFMPSYKVINSLGVLYKKKGRVGTEQLKRMQDLVWRNCVLCTRCYCPLGIDIPDLIALARSLLRTRGVCGVYPHTLGAPEEEYIMEWDPQELSDPDEDPDTQR